MKYLREDEREAAERGDAPLLLERLNEARGALAGMVWRATEACDTYESKLARGWMAPQVDVARAALAGTEAA